MAPLNKKNGFADNWFDLGASVEPGSGTKCWADAMMIFIANIIGDPFSYSVSQLQWVCEKVKRYWFTEVRQSTLVDPVQRGPEMDSSWKHSQDMYSNEQHTDHFAEETLPNSNASSSSAPYLAAGQDSRLKDIDVKSSNSLADGPTAPKSKKRGRRAGRARTAAANWSSACMNTS